MAQSQVSCIPLPRLSFAEIAARPVPRISTPSIDAHKSDERQPSKRQEVTKKLVPPTQSASHIHAGDENLRLNKETNSTTLYIEGLSLVNASPADKDSPRNVDSGDSYEEDRSQVSSSSLNKPHSFDTKSIASVTTFAMDDKESIRPDDSASVRAAEDDQAHPLLSRNSSYQRDAELVASRSTKSQVVSVVIPGRRFTTLANPPRFGNLPISPVLEAQDTATESPIVPVLSPDQPRSLSTTVPVTPDEKLLDALASPKDRLPLLQLEEKIIAFINNHELDTLDFPPQNPFTRLLTHRLADYYSLAHHVSDDNTSVRLFRTGYATLPPPLSQFARAIPLGSTTGHQAMAVKIMRRQQAGRRQFPPSISTAPSSSVASKTTSETGAESTSEEGLMSPTESTPGREKSRMTYEEREAQYKVVRDRIFADTQESNASEGATSTGDNSVSISRSSSPSGRKKAKRHKQPKDDSFDSRSAFVPSFVPSQPFYGTYVDASLMDNAPTSPSMYDSNMYGVTPTQSHYGTNMGVQHMNIAASFVPSNNPTFDDYDWQMPQQMPQIPPSGYMMYPDASAYQPPMPGGMMPSMVQPMSQTAEWYSQQYHMFTPPGSFTPQASLGASPYFGNPVHADAQFVPPDPPTHSMQSRTYIPAASHYGQAQGRHKSLFNPQTRSFVPNNNASRGSAKTKNKSHIRQSIYANIENPVSTHASVSVTKEDSLKQRYGTPSSLPKKPPPPESKTAVEPSACDRPLVINGSHT